jgi:hypothetical protein
VCQAQQHVTCQEYNRVRGQYIATAGLKVFEALICELAIDDTETLMAVLNASEGLENVTMSVSVQVPGHLQLPAIGHGGMPPGDQGARELVLAKEHMAKKASGSSSSEVVFLIVPRNHVQIVFL